jgi:hypothetical protein
MLNRSYRIAVAMWALAALCAAGAPVLADETETNLTEELDLGSLLELETSDWVAGCGFLPVGGIVDMTTEVPPSFYLQFAGSLLFLDGGPNVDKNDYLSNAYTDALNKSGAGATVGLELRAVPNIYLRFEVGGTLFSSGGSIIDNLNRRYEIEPLSMFFVTIGGAFYYPLLMLGNEPETASDTSGFQLYTRFGVGLRYITEHDAEMVDDPTGGLSQGDKFDFWHPNGGFTAYVGAGMEFRTDLFGLFVEMAVRNFEGPRPATHPRDYSNGEVIIAYPITVGFSFRIS